MAGGQERILRGRIRSIQATKKITRAMELIAASRIVKAQQRVAAAVPYSEKITEVVRDLAAAGAGTDAPLLAGRESISTTCYVAITADRGSVRRLQRRRPAGHRGRGQGRRRSNGKAVRRSSRSVARAPAYFHFRGYQLGESFTGFSDTPRLEDAKRIAALRHRAVHQRRRRQGRARLHAVHLRRQPGGRAAPARAAVGGDRGGTASATGNRRGPADAPAGDYEYEPDPARSSTRCCRATSRPACTPPCSTPRRPSTPSASGR